jgi:hypothetical protein
LSIIAKEPGNPAFRTEIADNLKSYQQAVRGYIETFSFDDNAVVICNEEGKILCMEPNCIINNELLVGNIFIIGTRDDGEFHSLTEEQTAKYLDMFKQTESIIDEVLAQNGGMEMN